jgi:hypothetical protein
MKAEIRSARLYFTLGDPTFEGSLIKARDRRTDAVVTLKGRWESTTDENTVFSISILDFNAATHGLWVIDGKRELELSPALDRFLLDMARVDDHEYMTRTVFGAGIRTLTPDDLLYTLYCHLDTIDLDNQFYGGLVTVLSFRIAEQIDSRAALLPKVLSSYERMIRVQRRRADHSVRWRISSALNLSILLLYLDMMADAERLVEEAVSQVNYNAMFPLTFMNHAALLALAGMIALDRDDKSLAYLRFSECVGLCNTSVVDLFSLRNNYFFQHEHDVRVLVDTGYQAAIAMAALSTREHPRDSKMTLNAKTAPFARITFAPIFGRFRSITNRLPTLADRCSMAIKVLAK